MSGNRRNQARYQPQAQQPALHPTPPPADQACNPRQRGGARRGGGEWNRVHNINVRYIPAVQPASFSASDGPPLTHLSTTSTTERNDPLWITGLAGAELYPMPQPLYIYSGAEALPHLVSVLHASCTAGSSGYARRVPESALSYYCGVLTYARMLQLVCANSGRTTYNEERFVGQIRDLSLRPPVLLALYLAGFGNTRVPFGHDHKFALRDRAYVATPNVGGFWGTINRRTQPLYQNYPSLGVYASRMQADLTNEEYTRYWNLPAAIHADLANGQGPSLAMLGYGFRARLSAQQRAFLESSGIFYNEPFPSANEDIPVCLPLLAAVQDELDNVQRLRLSSMPTSIVGSLAQLCLVTYENERAAVVEKPMVLNCVFRLPAELTSPASAFCYRVKHDVEKLPEGVVAPWCVWRYDPLGVTAHEWHELASAANVLRNDESKLIQQLEFRTTPYLIRVHVAAFHHNTNMLCDSN